MKRASLQTGRHAGLIMVSRDLARAVAVPPIAEARQAAHDDWDTLSPTPERVYQRSSVDVDADDEVSDAFAAGTDSKRDRHLGACCLAERRMLEPLASGAAGTPFRSLGDRVRTERHNAEAARLCGPLDQRVEPESGS